MDLKKYIDCERHLLFIKKNMVMFSDILNNKIIQDAKIHLHAAMKWICSAQDASGGGGVSRSYSLKYMKSHKKYGWLGAYPETTGYIIPTFINYYKMTGNEEFKIRAIKMAEWESKIQLENGAVQGATVDFPPIPAIFNTGQVLFGWACAFDVTENKRFLESARRAADFLVMAQDDDGAWRKYSSKSVRPGVNVYDARTSWGILEAYRITKDCRYKQAAVKNLDFVLGQQNQAGWFSNCCLEDDEHPLLHTIAYTMEGLLESGIFLEEKKYVEAAKRSADALLQYQKTDGTLYGRFDRNWRPSVRWRCLTGEAQTSLVWLRLYQHSHDKRYLVAASRLNRALMATQNLYSDDPGIQGGIKGAHPIWGDYGSYEYLNWAAKFFSDALMLEISLSFI